MNNSFKALVSSLAAILFFGLQVSAQTFSLKAHLQDAKSGEALGFATVSLTKTGAEKPSKYSLSDDKGNVSISEIRKGEYRIKAELMGYKTYEKSVSIADADLNLGTIRMDVDRKMLEAARVSAVGNSILIKKDTIEFNANAFKTTENDVLEDLLKKIPGVEVSEDGSITFNGETIKKITIDGKTFFLDDPQLASKNIPAKIVEKLKVVEKKSDQARFTGIDDGEEETIIDLSVKKGMMHGAFGNVMGGAGHDIPASAVDGGDWRYQTAAFLGNFKDHEQLSAVLNANNTNNRGFRDMSGSMMQGMRGGGMGRGQGGWGGMNGITTSYMGGINGAWDLCDDTMELGGNYLFNGTEKDVRESTDKTTYLGDSNLQYKTEGVGKTNTYGHRLGARLDYEISENTAIFFEPRLEFGHGDFSEASTDSTKTFYKETGETEISNESNSTSTGHNKNLSTSAFGLVRQRLWSPGATITVMGSGSFSQNSMDGFNRSTTTTYSDGVADSPDLIDQKYNQTQNSVSLWGRAVFTHKVGEKFFLEANYAYSWNKSESAKNTFDSDGQNYSVQNSDYSNSISNEYVNQEIGFDALWQTEKTRIQLGFAAKPTMTHNSTSTGGAYSVDTTRYTMNWAPQGMVYFEFNENTNFRAFYRGSSEQPSIKQLITVPDNTNPLSMSFGNPNLLPYFNHSLRGDFRYNNKKKFSSINARFNVGYKQRPIVNANWYDHGVSYTMPLNGDDAFSAGFNCFANIPVKKLDLTVSNMMRVNYSSSSNLVGKDISPDLYLSGGEFSYDSFFDNFDQIRSCFVSNGTRSLSATERLRLTYRKDNIEISASGRTRMNRSWYDIDGVSDKTLTWNNQMRATANWTIAPADLTLKGEFNYNWYEGYTTKQPSEYVLNAEIQKAIFHKKVTLAIKGYDILGQEKNLTVTDTDNYHVESVNNTLGRYVILSLTWRFGNFGGQKGGALPGMGRR